MSVLSENCRSVGARWMRLSLAIILLLFTSVTWPAGLKGFAGEGRPHASAILSEPGFELGEQWLKPYLASRSIDTLFRMVAEGIRFEPYEGALRTPQGTAITRKGNSLDQALLLKKVLDSKGYRSRLAEGQLNQDNASILIRGIYPPRMPGYRYSNEYAPFAPEKSNALIKGVLKHYWLEIDQGGGNWLPLDPSFPRAMIGEAYAKADNYYDQPLPAWHQVVSVRLMRKTLDGRTTKLFDIDKPVSELGYMPLSFSCMGVPLENRPGKKSAKKGSAAGLFGGAIGGDGSDRKREIEVDAKAQILGTQYQWNLALRGEGSVQSVHSVEFNKRDSLIAREWLDITLKVPGQPDRTFERLLFAAEDEKPEHQPRMYRRYLLELLPGSMRPELAEERSRQFGALSFKDWEHSLQGAKQDSDQATALAIDENLGSTLLQMIITRFAEASDEASDRAAYGNGVVIVRALPRLLIASAEMEGEKLELSMDLRLDEVEAIPYPGAPARVANLYQTGRGIMQSKMEGAILKKVTGQEALSTAALIDQAGSQGIDLRVLDDASLNEFVKTAGIPAAIGDHMKKSVSGGDRIIVPERAVTVADVKRWGWWQINEASGRNVGVMDNGLHAGMAEYTLSTKEIGLNPKMGFVVGMIIGADSTLFTISGLMLKYGEVTQAMIKEAKDFLESIICSSCPKAEASASVSASAGNDCFSKEISKGVSAKASIDYCAEYANGFKCASAMLMAGLTGGGGKAEIKAEASYSAGCKGGSVEAGVSRGF